MQFNKSIKINNKIISNDSPTFIIAEAGVNHNGDINLAKQLIDVAVEARADAIKFQSFKAEELILSNVEKAPYQKNTTTLNESQMEMLKKLEVSKQQMRELKEYCEKKGIIFLTTPFDEYSLEELDDLNLSAYKVASTDTTNLLLLEKMAQKGKPIILSTGMCYLSEVQIALETISKFNQDVILLQCTANYPIKENEANLSVIETYKKNFDILVGYSDHSEGVGAAPYSIPMGAKVVEKHFTLTKDLAGPDHKASLSPNELIEFVKVIRQVELFMGSPIKKPNFSETFTRSSLQKCLVAKTNINKDELLTKENLIAKRTGGVGISPIYINDVINTKSKRAYQKNEIIQL